MSAPMKRASNLHGDSLRRTTAHEAVEDKITGVGRGFNNAFDEFFGFLRGVSYTFTFLQIGS